MNFSKLLNLRVIGIVLLTMPLFCACPQRPEVATYHLVSASQMAEQAEFAAREAKADVEQARILREEARQGIPRTEKALAHSEEHIWEAKEKLHKLGVRFQPEGIR